MSSERGLWSRCAWCGREVGLTIGAEIIEGLDPGSFAAWKRPEDIDHDAFFPWGDPGADWSQRRTEEEACTACMELLKTGDPWPWLVREMRAIYDNPLQQRLPIHVQYGLPL